MLHFQPGNFIRVPGQILVVAQTLSVPPEVGVPAGAAAAGVAARHPPAGLHDIGCVHEDLLSAGVMARICCPLG